MAAVLSGTALAGCGTPAQPNKPDDDVGTKFDLPDAPEGAVIEEDGNKALAAGGYRLDFVKTGDAYGINVVDASASTAAPWRKSSGRSTAASPLRPWWRAPWATCVC